MGVDIKIGDQMSTSRAERPAAGETLLNIDPKYFVGQRQPDYDSCAYFVLAGLAHFAEDFSGQAMAVHSASRRLLVNKGFANEANFVRIIIREHLSGVG